MADIAVLATGHVLEKPDPQAALSNPWEDPGPVDPQGRVVLVGTGLTMVDRVITLLKTGHKGEILAVSRRGLLPRTHAPTSPLPSGRRHPVWRTDECADRLDAQPCRTRRKRGGTWRDAVDGVRPHVKAIWRSLPLAERARFLRHAATLWDVHRHRIPPQSATIIEEALSTGKLRLMRAAFLGAARDRNGQASVTVRRIGQRNHTWLDAAMVFDCAGSAETLRVTPSP